MINTKNILKIGIVIVILIFVLPVVGSRLYLLVVSEVGYVGIVTTFKENTSRDRALNSLSWLSKFAYRYDIENFEKIKFGGYFSIRINPPPYLEGPAYLFLRMKNFTNPHVEKVYYGVAHLE